MPATVESPSIADLVDAVVIEPSGDTLLRLALRADLPSQTLRYAMEAAAAYSLAAEAMTEQSFVRQRLLYKKLRVAKALEGCTAQYLLEKGTESALTQLVLANPTSEDAKTYLGRIRAGQAEQVGNMTISSLVDLEQPPDRGHDIAAIVTLSQVLQETVQDLNRYAAMAQYYRHLSMDDYRSNLGLLNQANNHLNVIIPLYAQLALEEPTAVAKVKELLGTKLEELVQLQGQVAEALTRT